MKVNNTINFAKANLMVRAAIELYGNTAAGNLESYAKAGAPWIDRTSNARNSIQGKFEWQGKKAVINLSGNMDYSVYLELAMGKKYAILVPTIQKHGPNVVKGYKKVIG